MEKDDVVGGLARTVSFKNCHFDLGGHRFFTKVELVQRLWREVLGNDRLTRPRLSRIYFENKIYKYPLEPLDVVFQLGLRELLRCGASYLRAQVSPRRPETDMAAWIANRFGHRLCRKFFQTYTEKVWGIPCSEIRADWASQRINGLTLGCAVRDAFRSSQPRGKTQLRTLTREFLYQRRGPGMMWNRMRDRVESMGSLVHLNAPVERIFWGPGRLKSALAGGRMWSGAHFISTLPIRNLILSLDRT